MVVIALGGNAAALEAQRVFNAASDTGRVDAATRSQVLLAAAKLLEEHYVFPDSGRRFAEFLRQKAADPTYAAIGQAGALGVTLTTDLRNLSHDKHLTILTPVMAKAAFVNRDGPRDMSARSTAERARNYFFDEYRNLEGNVGYLRLRQFPVPDSSARSTATAAMRLLANAEAIILDLRDNPGGVEGLNQWVSSFFFDDPSRVLYQRYYREVDSTISVRVLAQLPGPRMPVTPLFVLVNRGTGSAAENMAYALQTAGRAKVVGEPTAGAANSSTILPLPGGFAMQVPVARVISPVTGRNWEDDGVQPDVRTPRDSAEIVAQRLARAATSADAVPDSVPPKRIVMPPTVEVPLLGSGADGSARPAVEIRINGRGPFRFLVETGAAGVDLSPALADSLGLPLRGHNDGPQFHVDSISVGAATFHDLTVSSLPPAVTSLGVSGVLGLALWRNLLLTIDYPAHKLRLSRDSLPSPDGQSILPLTRVSDFWGLPIRIGGHAFTGVLDTQNSRTLIVPPAVADQLAFDGGLQVIGKARGAFGTVDVKGGRLSGDIAIGKYTFPTPFLSLTQLPPEYPNQPNVGSGILSYFVVSLDQRHSRLRLVRDGSSSITLPGPSMGPGPAPGSTQAPPSAGLAALGGLFGDRTVSIANGKLVLQRPGGRPNELVLVARDTFTIADFPQARIVFVHDSAGAVNEIRVLNAEGKWETSKRIRP